jgi:DNA (cytosine-5)-methyltransferase 1
MTHGSLFSGIGGFELAAQWMDWDNIFHCEWNEFGQKVLKHHFPKSISYADITKTDFSIHRGAIDILTGGFPCQPYSTAGKRLGKEDERHLWPEMLRAIREIEPRWVVGENVRGLVSWSGGLVFEEVQTDLEAQGYEVQPFLLPAASVNAPHRRDRIWFVAFKDTNNNGWGSFERKEESGIWEQRNSCTGNNERLRTDDDKIRSTTNTNNTRSNEQMRLNREWSEKDKGWKGQPQFKSWQNGFNGSIAHSNDNRTGDGFGQIQGKDGEVSEWNDNAESCNTDKFNDVTNTCSSRLEANNFMRESEREIKFARNDGKNVSTDSTIKRLEGSEWGSSEGNRFMLNDWNKFPTVAPVCNGDDGLSDRLDSITFPKWRNESIKAGGNAIVPQVAHQIFKAIQEYEQHYGSRLQ